VYFWQQKIHQSVHSVIWMVQCQSYFFFSLARAKLVKELFKVRYFPRMLSVLIVRMHAHVHH
jgi:hypothetical protein